MLGLVVLVLVLFLTGFVGTLRLREYLAEKPDPKTTYASLAEVEKLRLQVSQLQRDCRTDLAALDQKRSRSMAEAHELIRKNAEHIATLIAQTQMTMQRVAELSVKTERIQEKLTTSPALRP